MDIALSFILGVLIRLGIPVAVTVLALVLLHQLDRRWKNEALALPVIPSGKRCWEIKGCSDEKKKNCPAFARQNEPCWQVFRSKNGLMKETCVGCEVFRRAPVPVKL